MKPRLLLLVNRLTMSGPAPHVLSLAKGLSQQWEIKIISGLPQQGEAMHPVKGEDVELIHTLKRPVNLLSDWKAYWQIKKVISSFKPQIIHTHASKPGVLGRIAAPRSAVTVHTFHGDIFSGYFNKLGVSLALQIEKALAKRTNAVIALSPELKNRSVQYLKIPPQKVHVLPLGIDTELFANAVAPEHFLPCKENCLVIGFFGRFEKVKNLKMLVNAFTDLKTNQFPVKLLLVGGGSQENALMNQFIQNKISVSRRIEKNADAWMLSWSENIGELMALTDIVALSSQNEGTPVMLMEAQAAGKVIVATRVGGVSDIVKPGITALLSEPNDIKTFALNLKKAVSDTNFRQIAFNHGRILAANEFSLSSMVHRYHSFYQHLLQSNS